MNRYHGYLGGNYGTNELMGVMTRRGNLSEYYEASEITGNEVLFKIAETKWMDHRILCKNIVMIQIIKSNRLSIQQKG